MNPFSEAVQISIVSIGIVFTSLLVFSFLIQIMGSYFHRIGNKPAQSVTSERISPIVKDPSIDRKKIAAIMTVFQEEFGDKLAEVKIFRANGKEIIK